MDEFSDTFEEKTSKKRKDSYSYNDYREDIDIEEKEKIRDKVTSVKNYLDIFQKRLEGYEYVSQLDKITYTGRVLAGTQVIQKLTGLISPFSENTNLIGEVVLQDYYRKKHRIHSTANAILLTDSSVLPENVNTIMEMFKNTFVNIGNVINHSKNLMRGQFLGEEALIRQEDDL
jgi:hypothetical protein